MMKKSALLTIASTATLLLSCQKDHQHSYDMSYTKLAPLLEQQKPLESSPSLTYETKPIRAIDIHQHPGSFDDLGPLGKKFVLGTIKANWIPDAVKSVLLRAASKQMLSPYGFGIGIKSECQRAGLIACGLFAVHAPEAWGIVSNEKIIAALDDRRNISADGQEPYFYGFATINMEKWRSEEALQAQHLREVLSHPQMVAIKLAFVHNNIPLSDTAFDSIYQIAADTSKPVYHHIGSSPLRKMASFDKEAGRKRYLKSYDPMELERVIKEYPDTNFILGHMGFDFADDGYDFMEACYRLAEDYDNVYLEMSSFGRNSHDGKGKLLEAVLGEVKDRGLVEKLIYGSDGPSYPGATKQYLEKTMAAFLANGYTFEEVEAVLYSNFATLSGIIR